MDCITLQRKHLDPNFAPMTAEEISGLAAVSWRTGELEKRIERLESRIDAGFIRLETTVQGLRFVSHDLYVSEHLAQNERIDAGFKTQNERVNAALKLAWWAVVLVCTFVIGAIVTLAFRLASA